MRGRHHSVPFWRLCCSASLLVVHVRCRIGFGTWCGQPGIAAAVVGRMPSCASHRLFVVISPCARCHLIFLLHGGRSRAGEGTQKAIINIDSMSVSMVRNFNKNTDNLSGQLRGVLQFSLCMVGCVTAWVTCVPYEGADDG